MGFIELIAADQTLPRLIFGVVLSVLIGILAYRRGSLSRSGLAGTVLVGTLVVGFGGWIAGILLVAFFVSSTALSHFKQNSAPKRQAAEQFEKGGTRDLGQVLANGGAAAIFAVAFWTLPLTYDGPDPSFSSLMRWIVVAAGMVGALATVNADTWATELGVLSRTPPRSILTFRIVEPGASGGISLVGTLAALGGSFFIAGLYWLCFVMANRSGASQLASPTFIAAVLGGFIGALFDSFLGATAQAMYYSQRRQKLTEKAFEADGTPNQLTRGFKWLNNDWVNFISSIVGALVSVALAMLLI